MHEHMSQVMSPEWMSSLQNYVCQLFGCDRMTVYIAEEKNVPISKYKGTSSGGKNVNQTLRNSSSSLSIGAIGNFWVKFIPKISSHFRSAPLLRKILVFLNRCVVEIHNYDSFNFSLLIS